MARQIQAGESIKLRARFKNDLGDSTTASGVFVHIFEPGEDTSDLANAILVSGVPTLLGEGIYEFDYLVDGCGPDGIWHDSWEGTLTCQNLSSILSFEVSADGSLEAISSQLTDNQLIEVIIASGIQDTDGNLLSEEFEFEFMTTTSPSYTNLRKVRLEIGGLVPNLADDTLQTAILEASLEADVLTFAPGRVNNKLFLHARREYTTCLAASMLLTNTGNSSLKAKTLGDFHVEYDTAGSRDAIERVRDCLAKWEPQLLAGGGAKAATQPMGVVKGDLDPERPIVSRMWESTWFGNQTPAANARVRSPGERRAKRTYRKKWW